MKDNKQNSLPLARKYARSFTLTRLLVFIETLEVHLPPIIMQITPLKPYRFITCLVRPMVVQIKSFFDKIFQFRFSR